MPIISDYDREILRLRIELLPLSILFMSLNTELIELVDLPQEEINSERKERLIKKIKEVELLIIKWEDEISEIIRSKLLWISSVEEMIAYGKIAEEFDLNLLYSLLKSLLEILNTDDQENKAGEIARKCIPILSGMTKICQFPNPDDYKCNLDSLFDN